MEGRDVDPYAFLADQDPDPAVFLNADRIRIQLFFSMRTGSGSSLLILFCNHLIKSFM